MTFGILAYGAYLPKARLQREEIVAAHRWMVPGLAALGKGERTMANWDEDSITMAVEACRDCLSGLDRAQVSGLFVGSTTFPFLDRQNSGVVADALGLSRGLLAVDVAASRRAASSALALALSMAGSLSGPVLAVGSERSRSKAASSQELTQSDGAAALLVGEGDAIATLVGQLSHTVDFIDHYRGEGEDYDYHWEERWVREEGYFKIVPEAIGALLAQTGASPADITRFCFPSAMRKSAAGIAKRVGLPEEAVADNLQANCGETGAAHPLVMLVHALEAASAGDRILVASFGQGCDVFLLEVTEAISALSPRNGVSGALARRFEERRYTRYLSFNGMLPLEFGIRSEMDKNTGLSTHYRNKHTTQQLLGGKCTRCGTIQFPRTRICVGPNCGAVDSQVAEPMADKPVRIKSFTADRLTYTPDPPNNFGMISFEGGGRLMNDFTDVDPGLELAVGMPMRMMFRVKDYDTRRGFRRYFWKASPVGGAHEAAGE